MHLLILSDLMLLHDCGLYFDRDELKPKKFRGNPLNLPARMWLILLVKSAAALKIFQKKKRGQVRGRRERNWDERQVIP